MTYHCRHFAIEELVPPEVFSDRGDAAWELLDPRALETLDQLRDKFGPITINNWGWGGTRRYSGYRPENCSVGATYSQHKYGRAFDGLFHDIPAQEVRDYVRAHPEEFPYITSLEEGISWFHFDTRNCDPIKVFYP